MNIHKVGTRQTIQNMKYYSYKNVRAIPPLFDVCCSSKSISTEKTKPNKLVAGYEAEAYMPTTARPGG